MKTLMILTLGLFFVSCSSTSQPSHDEGRDVASAQSQCHLQKHDSKDWYRLMVGEKPYNKFWYSQSKAQKQLEEHKSEGHCR